MDHGNTEKEKIRRIIPTCVGEQLRVLYADMAKEAFPAQFAVLLQRLDEARSSSTAIERESRGRHRRQRSI